jgi:hypothetical protein
MASMLGEIDKYQGTIEESRPPSKIGRDVVKDDQIGHCHTQKTE